jgi:hypothetical protein
MSIFQNLKKLLEKKTTRFTPCEGNFFGPFFQKNQKSPTTCSTKQAYKKYSIKKIKLSLTITTLDYITTSGLKHLIAVSRLRC